MVSNATPLWAWALPLVFGSPWIAASVWFWLQRPRDGALPQSMAELARKRL